MAMNIYRNEQLKEPKMKGYIYENVFEEDGCKRT
jgi:hypothetical protein